MSNFTFFHNVFYAICILKSFNGHISVVVCSFFEFWTVSKWCIKEWVHASNWSSLKFCCFFESGRVNLVYKFNLSDMTWRQTMRYLQEINTKPCELNYFISSPLPHCWDGHSAVNPFPNNRFQTLQNWKSLQTTILNLTKMCGKFSKGKKNTRYEQFLLFPQCDLYFRHIKTRACSAKG